MTVIGLLTDFGYKDGYVGVMKGVMLAICPQAQLVDISHEVSPQGILEGVFVLRQAFSYFPPGAIFLTVIDPGVGTERKALAARVGQFAFVGPDNGVITPLLRWGQEKRLEAEIVILDQPRYWLPDVSTCFDGRDIFAPVAAYLAAGVPLGSMGSPTREVILLDLPAASPQPGGFQASVLFTDHFGNVVTNLQASEVQVGESLTVQIAGRRIHGMVRTFGERPPGTLIALADSSGYLAISLVQRNAARYLGVSAGDPVIIYLRQPG